MTKTCGLPLCTLLVRGDEPMDTAAVREPLSGQNLRVADVI